MSAEKKTRRLPNAGPYLNMLPFFLQSLFFAFWSYESWRSFPYTKNGTRMISISWQSFPLLSFSCENGLCFELKVKAKNNNIGKQTWEEEKSRRFVSKMKFALRKDKKFPGSTQIVTLLEKSHTLAGGRKDILFWTSFQKHG